MASQRINRLREWLADAMAGKEWNQADLQRATGISEKGVRNLLKDPDKQRINPGTQRSLEGAFGLERGALYAIMDGEPDSGPQPREMAERMADLTERIEKLERLPDEVRAIRQLLDRLTRR